MEGYRANAEIIKELLGEYDLSPSARSFVLSVRAWNERRPLTKEQSYALIKIKASYENCSRNLTDHWINEWDKEKKEIAMVCAHYYKANPPYYGDLAHRVITDEAFIPTKTEYDKFTNNRYIKKVLAEHETPALFSLAELVLIRRPAARSLDLMHLENCPLVIVKLAAAPITSSAKGSKRHLVLPIGSKTPVLIEERHLKKNK